ncbi:uncharacterized protein LOC116298732 isoform X2 [Actinia tenebrosa]|uniref:Uncharacterized protein LOC116298732 isoform X2 n=1 Tax=Actinia tenebrosa TaxID=6105 RepID=A0A6P8I739_ACTTE|nr:uncharacterized protein LOC116298732 isoform X2 [Actinia tenebrosa]
MDTSIKNEPSFWRPWLNDDQDTITCVDQGFASPPRKRMRVYYTDEQRQDMRRIYDPEVRAVIKRQLTVDLKAKKKQIQEYLRKRTGVRRRDTVNSNNPARHAIPAMLTGSLATTSPASQTTVTTTTNHLRTSTTCMTSVSPVNKPSDPLEESLTLDSIVMVPFLRINGGAKADCESDDDYCYVSAAKFLGFYRITDDRSD